MVDWQSKLDAAADEVHSFVQTIERNRCFTPMDVPGLPLQSDEFAIRVERATLGRLRRIRIGSWPGNRWLANYTSKRLGAEEIWR